MKSDNPQVRAGLFLISKQEAKRRAAEQILTGYRKEARRAPKGTRMQRIKWYCSVRHWRQGVAAVTIYSAMFAIWNIAVR